MANEVETIKSSDLNDSPNKTQLNQPVNQSNPNTQKGSGYVNIQKIVNANKNNQLGQTIGNNVQQAGQQTKNNIQQAGQNFQQQSDQNRFDTTDNQQLSQNVLQDPTQYQNNPQGQQFTHLLSGQYSGPTTLENADQLQNQARDVSQMGQSIGSAYGRLGLLQRYAGNPNYQAGQQRLDNLILGQTGAPQLQQARQFTQGLQNQFNTQLTGAQNIGKEYTNRAQQFGQNLQGQFTQNLTDQDKSLQDKATQEQISRDTMLQNVHQQLSSGQLNQDLANQLGITQGQRTFNLDPNSFLNESNLKASAQNVANQQDYAKLAALKQLGGTFSPSEAQDIFGKYTGQEAQAGTFDKEKAYTPDKEGYQKAVSARQEDYNNRLNPVQSQYEEAQDINRLATGQLTSQEKQDWDAQNPGLRNQMMAIAKLGGNVGDIDQQISLSLLRQKYPGAVGPGAGGGNANLATAAGAAAVGQYGAVLPAMGGMLGGQGSGPADPRQWAAANLQTKQRNLQNIRDQLNQAYGTGTYNINQSQS